MQSIFIRPTTPHNILQLWHWLIFEPVLLKGFLSTLNNLEILKWFLKGFASLLVIYLLLIMLRFFLVFGVVEMDLPTIIPALFHPSVVEFWRTGSDGHAKVLFLFFNDLGYGLAVSLIGSIIAFRSALHLPEGVMAGFLFGLVSSLIIALISCLTFGILGGVIYAFAYGLMVGAALGSVAGVASILSTPLEQLSGLFMGFMLSVIGCLAVAKLGIMGGELQGLTDALGFGVGILLGWYALYFGLIFYPFHWISSCFYSRLDCNPYLYDARIWLPISGLKKRLTQQARLEPELAGLFIDFLLNYRPLQHSLAKALSHAVAQDNLKSP